MESSNKAEATLNLISLITLSIVTFGILVLGMLVAPTIFKEVVPRSLASEVMTHIFGKYYSLGFIAISISLICEIIRFSMLKKIVMKSKLELLRFFSILVVFLFTTYSAKHIYPTIDSMRIENNTPTLWNNPDFVVLHKTSESLAKITFIFGLLGISLIVFKKSE